MTRLRFAIALVVIALGTSGVTGFNIWSMIVAIIGAVIVLWLYNALAKR